MSTPNKAPKYVLTEEIERQLANITQAMQELVELRATVDALSKMIDGMLAKIDARFKYFDDKRARIKDLLDSE